MLTLAGLIAFFILRPRGEGPIVRGKHLSVWLDDLNPTEDRQLVLSQASVDAVQTLGADAIPTLLKWIATPTRTSFLPAFRLRKVWYDGELALFDYFSIDHGRRAVFGFRALGPAARPAFPRLVDLAVRSPSEATRLNAINALTSSDDTAAQAFAAAFEDPDGEVRARAAYAITCLPLNPDILMPALQAASHDPDPVVAARMHSAITSMVRRWGQDRIDAALKPQK